MTVEITDGWNGIVREELGQVPTMQAACYLIGRYDRENVGECAEQLGFTRLAGGVTVVDFGSHIWFGRVKE